MTPTPDQLRRAAEWFADGPRCWTAGLAVILTRLLTWAREKNIL